MKIEVREEKQEDASAIRAVNEQAFGQSQEANIVEALRMNGGIMLSLVAMVHSQVVGHILYSPIDIAGKLAGAALAPMAVLPQFQGKGVGSTLVRAGNKRLKESGCPYIIVLGHADYYPRFGFKPAATFGVTCEWDVPENVFMLLVLDETRLRGVSGLAKYRTEFSAGT